MQHLCEQRDELRGELQGGEGKRRKKTGELGGKRGKMGLAWWFRYHKMLWFNVDPSYTKGRGEQKQLLDSLVGFIKVRK